MQRKALQSASAHGGDLLPLRAATAELIRNVLLPRGDVNPAVLIYTSGITLVDMSCKIRSVTTWSSGSSSYM